MLRTAPVFTAIYLTCGGVCAWGCVRLSAGPAAAAALLLLLLLLFVLLLAWITDAPGPGLP